MKSPRFLNGFKKKCVRNVMAEYSIKTNGQLRVLNSCVKADGVVTQALGEAKVVDTQSNAKLRVTFASLFNNYIYLFGGAYWIIDLDPNYTYAVVGHPKATYGWILSRTPSLPRQDILRISENLRVQGYDTCKFIMTFQEGGNTVKETLCKYLQSN